MNKKNSASVPFSSLVFSCMAFVATSQVYAADAKPAAPAAQTAPTAPAATPSSSSGTMLSIVPTASGSSSSHSEDWKGSPDKSAWTLTALTGLGIVDASPGFALIGAAARKILDRGFIPDINNDVWLEGEAGPVFAKGGTALFFSAHLRWDFVKDDSWTLYALGGFGGSNDSRNLDDKFEFFPRFGAGVLWNIFADFTIRAEISHELVVAGAQFVF